MKNSLFLICLLLVGCQHISQRIGDTSLATFTNRYGKVPNLISGPFSNNVNERLVERAIQYSATQSENLQFLRMVQSNSAYLYVFAVGRTTDSYLIYVSHDNESFTSRFHYDGD